MIIKLQPIFFEKVWGGNNLKNKYNYNCLEQTGEAWGISAHKNGSSIILNGEFKDMSLRDLFKSHKELFGNYPGEEFPILIKLIDATLDLSVQVHPNDEYAKKYENSLGKTECWYILNTEEKAKLIIGHKLKSKEEFIREMNLGNWDKILNRFRIHTGETYCVPSGTIHAICKGTLLLEIQQSSDVTYRLYDYNRPYNGKLRELHIDKALDVITFPDKDINHPKPKQLFDFDIYNNIDITNRTSNKYGDYIFIIEGKGYFNTEPVKKGDFIFVSSKTDYKITGSLKYFHSIINS